MEIGFHTIHFSPVFGGTTPLLDVLAITARAGFDVVGLDLPSVDAFLGGGGTVDEIVGAYAAHGLRCSDLLVLAPGGDDPDLLATAVRMGELADRLHPTHCIAAQAGPLPAGDLVAVLTRCADIVAEHGMRLAIEFTPYSPLDRLRGAKDLCAAIGWDRSALVLDSLHVFRGRTPWAELADLDGDQIALVQFSDAPAARPDSLVDESRHGRLVPGTGGLPLDAFVDAVRATGFDGTASAEILSEPFRRADPLDGARAVHATMRAAWLSEAGR